MPLVEMDNLLEMVQMLSLEKELLQLLRLIYKVEMPLIKIIKLESLMGKM